MAIAPRDRFFGGFVALGRRRPFGVLGLLVALFVVGMGLGSQIDVNTSRFEMVRSGDPYQARLMSFFERFGYPDSPILIVSGADREQRRATVDRLMEEFSADPMFQGRALGRVTAGEIAEVLLLQQPDAIKGLRDALPPDADLPAMIEGGLPTMVGGIEAQLLAALDGEVQVDPSQQDEGFTQLAEMATLLDRQLAGEDLGDALGEMAGGRVEQARASGIDEAGYLESRDGETLLVALFPEMPGTQAEDYEPVVERIRAIQSQVGEAAGDVQIQATGLPILTVDEEDSLAISVIQSSVGSGVGVLVLLLLFFRSLRTTIFALVPLVLGMGMALGLVQIVFGHVNPITGGMFAILFGLGIDFAVHLLARFQEFLREGQPRSEAIKSAVLRAGPGVFTGGVTSVVAFLTVVTATFTAFAEFGIISAIGLLLVFLCTLVLLPILLEKFGGGDAPPKLPGIHLLPVVARKGAMVTVAIAFVATGAAAYGATQVGFNPRYFDNMPQNLESVKALDQLEKDGALSPLFAFVSAEDVETAREMAEELRQLPAVGQVQTPTDLLPKLSQAQFDSLGAGFAGLARDPDFDELAARKPSARELSERIGAVVDALDELRFALEQADRSTKTLDEAKAAFKQLKVRVDGLPDDGAVELGAIESELAALLGRAWKTGRAVAERGQVTAADLPDLFRARYVSKDGKEHLSMFAFPERPIWGEGEAERFSAQVSSVDPQAAGHAISMYVHNEMILADFVRASLMAGGLVFVVLFIDFRRLSDTLLAMTPVVLGGVWMMAIMAVVDFPFTVATLMVLPFLIGLSIDAGVHLMHRTRQSSEQNDTARLEDLLSGTGSAVLVASVTTIVGFAGLLVADHGAMKKFGLTMMIGISATLLATVVVLPAILVLLKRAR
jgi:hypothetical protein